MADDGNTGRDARGRFALGNAGGPGAPRGRRDELRKAAEDAVTPEHAAALMRRAARMGLEGNLTAIKLVLDRACGRPAESSEDQGAVPIELPGLKSAAECSLAIERVIEALCDGSLQRAAAETLIKAIQVRLKAIEVVNVEDRLSQLEQAAAQADPTRKGGT